METVEALRRLVQRVADERLVAEGRAQGWRAALEALRSEAEDIIKEEETESAAAQPQPEAVGETAIEPR